MDDSSADEIRGSDSDAKQISGAAKPEVKQTPLWAWGILAIAVTAMSSGGIWFRLMGDAPPWLKACWRLTITAAVQFPQAAM